MTDEEKTECIKNAVACLLESLTFRFAEEIADREQKLRDDLSKACAEIFEKHLNNMHGDNMNDNLIAFLSKAARRASNAGLPSGCHSFGVFARSLEGKP